MKLRMMLVGVLVALVLSGCAGTYFKWDKARQVQPGMTEAEVVEILGPPYMRRVSGDTTMLVWSYSDTFTGTRAVSYKLVDGRVVETPFQGSAAGSLPGGQ